MKDISLLPDEIILNKIYLIRDQKVMLDRDLAKLYGVETKVLKQAVKRNIQRFPDDFMFEMSESEFQNWRSQFVTSKSDKTGLRYAPYCFTEQGVTMLSCVLSSDRAIKVNIQIIRLFNKMRQMMLTHKDILLKLQEIEQKFSDHDDKIHLIFEYLNQFEASKQQQLEYENREPVGYKIPKKD